MTNADVPQLSINHDIMQLLLKHKVVREKVELF